MLLRIPGSSRRWKLILGLVCIPAIGFIAFRVSMLSLLLLITLALLPFDREVGEFTRIPLAIDLASMVISGCVMVICIRVVARFGEESAERDEGKDPSTDETHDR